MATRRISVKELVRDIRRGITDSDLISKYHLSSDQLRNVFKKLIDAGVLKHSDLNARTSLHGEPDAADQYRELERVEISLTVPVFDADDLLVEGVLSDATEKGVKITGVEAEVDEIRTFLIEADDFPEVEPFEFDARCADQNAADNKGYTALMMAAFKGHPAATKLLMNRGADVNAGSHKGGTALIRAASAGRLEVVRLLLFKGADVNTETKKGLSALSVASANHFKDISTLLIAYGAK